MQRSVPNKPLLKTWQAAAWVVVKDIAIGAGSLGFDSRAVEIGLSVAYGAPPLRRFMGAVLLER